MEGIIILAIILIAIFTIKKYVKNLSSGKGCCGSDSDYVIKPKDKNIKHYPYQKEIHIQGMSCDHCKLRIENEFNAYKDCMMKIDLKENKGILYTKKEWSNQDITQSIERLGYQVSTIL